MTFTRIDERLRIDPGQRTLGELIQDREASLHEIRRLRAEIDRLRARTDQRLRSLPLASGRTGGSEPSPSAAR